MAKKWDSSIQFPSDSDYVARIIKVDLDKSSSGNPMFIVNWELVSPEEKEIGGEVYNLAGIKTRGWNVFTVNEGGEVNTKKTDEARHRVIDNLFQYVGLKMEDINWDNPDFKPLIGKSFYVLMEADITERRKTPTLAQVEEAKKKGVQPQGDIMKHPVTGKNLVSYFPQVKQIFGLCEGAATGSAGGATY